MVDLVVNNTALETTKSTQAPVDSGTQGLNSKVDPLLNVTEMLLAADTLI